MEYEYRELQSRVEDAAFCSGAGTELVTVWIPADKNLDTVRSRLKGETAEAENIQSKQTRERVVGALERALNVLHKYDETPENGLVICTGYLEHEDGYVDFVFDDLPEPLHDSKYECSNEFAVQPLREMAFGGSEYWGLITVTRDSASIGRYTSTDFDHVDVIDTFESQVMGKSKAGGQSQARFARVREKQQEEHYKKVVSIAEASFDPNDEDFMGLALGGPNVTLSDFVDWLPSRLESEIVTTETVDHAGSRESLVSLAEAAEHAFDEQENQRERELVQRFKEGLASDGSVTYGKPHIDRAIEYGAVDTLLIASDFAPHYIDERRQAVEQQGGDVVIISTMHEEGHQLDSTFGGEAALLRFDIE